MDDGQFAPANAVAWLLEQMENNRVSQRNAARATGLDSSLLSRSFSGSRKMRMSEFASILAYVESVMPRMETPIQRAMWSSRLTMLELSKLTKISIPRLINIVGGKGEPVSPEEETKLRGPLNGFRPFENLTSAGPETRRPPSEQNRFIDPWAAPLLDVYAAPWRLDGGYYRRSTSIVDRRDRPAGLSRVPGAYAFIVGDEGLQPRWYPGEVLFVHPGQPPLVGRWSIATTVDDRMLIGRILRSNGKTISVETPTSGLIEIEVDQVQGFEAIVGSWNA